MTPVKRIPPFLALPALCLAAALLAGCSTPRSSSESAEAKAVPRILLDTDVGSSPDDLFALAMLRSSPALRSR